MFAAAVTLLSFVSFLAQTACFARLDRSRLVAQASEKDSMSISDAKQYMITLINRDRKTQGLNEVTADETAELAAVLHSDEMAKLGYLSHWDRTGRKPDQRYCSVGGTGFVMEKWAHRIFPVLPETMQAARQSSK